MVSVAATARVLRVAAVFIGTVVGAGFASGQEVLRFFVAYGSGGLRGILLAGVIFCVFGVLFMHMGRALRARSHREVLRQAAGGRWATIPDVAVTACLFAALAVMLSGGGAVAAQLLGLPTWIGTLGTAGLTVLTILRGMRGLMLANSVVVPLLTVAVLALTMGALWHHGTWLSGAPAPLSLAPSPRWWQAAVLYAGYNLVLSLPVLAPLGAEAGPPLELTLGGLLGGGVLTLLAVAQHLAIGLHLPESARVEVPMLLLAQVRGGSAPWLYAVVLWAEVYTTAIAGAFGVARRLAGGQREAGPPYRVAAVAAVAGALLLSPVGFGRLVGTIYPLLGYLSLGLMVALAAAAWRLFRP